MALEASASKDQFPLIATITFGGKPSDGFVGGTEQIPGGPYRVLIPTTVLQAKIAELIDKPVFASDSLTSHSNNIEIGEFMQAWVEPVQDPETGEFISVAKASGMLFRDRDPDLVDRIISGARNGILGFSWDIGNIKFNLVELPGPEKVVKISDLEWRGATVLKKDTAAYKFTQLAAFKTNGEYKENNSMDKETISAIKETISEEFKQYKANALTKDDLKDLEGSVSSIQEKVTVLEEKQTTLEASIKADPKDPKKDPPKDPPDNDPPTEDEELSIKDFGKILSGAMVEANKPVLKALEELKTKSPEGDPASNGRKSISGGEIEHIFAKYVDKDEIEDDEQRTVAGLKIAIAAVKDKVQSRRSRDDLLSTLGTEKRRLIKIERRRQGLGL